MHLIQAIKIRRQLKDLKPRCKKIIALHFIPAGTPPRQFIPPPEADNLLELKRIVKKIGLQAALCRYGFETGTQIAQKAAAGHR